VETIPDENGEMIHWHFGKFVKYAPVHLEEDKEGAPKKPT